VLVRIEEVKVAAQGVGVLLLALAPITPRSLTFINRTPRDGTAWALEADDPKVGR
jgi:hypothetical protein